ncbi:MAG TPA: VIT1/CCC1 transporter family protein [Conexivisphaerales archaeon]|nr:VIT1/CCC1 transporter family protein [Conexivisphaerales archaeon]
MAPDSAGRNEDLKSQSTVELHPHSRLRDFVADIQLGVGDGLIDGSAFLAALNAAGMAFGTIVFSGIVFALAGAISMFLAAFFSKESEISLIKQDFEREAMEVREEPEEERRELDDILKAEGYDDSERETMLGIITKEPERWLNTQMLFELHTHREELKPRSSMRALPVGLAFAASVLFIVTPYLFDLTHAEAIVVSLALASLLLFVSSSTQFMRVRGANWWAGLKSVVILLLASLVLYAIGYVFKVPV